MFDSLRVGIVGAGLSGLMAARTLLDHGIDVTLFDKGRRPGGRANTREHGSYRFDHGAQFFTVRGPHVSPLLNSWMAEGLVERWLGKLVRIDGDRVLPAKDSHRYVGVPAMITLPEYLARGLDIRTGVRVGSLRREEGGWAFMDTSGGKLASFPLALVAVPAPQAVPLLSEVPDLEEQAQSVGMAPCWAGMYVFEDGVDLDFDGAFISGQGLSWVARNNSKPGRPEPEAWVIHAGPEWTEAHWDLNGEEAAEALGKEMAALFGPLPKVAFQRAHRWAYALPPEPVSGESLFHPELGIGVCGDWCRGGRVEGAIESGVLLAQQVINQNILRRSKGS